MGKKPPVNDKVLNRKPAHEVLLDFVKFNNLVLIIDEVVATIPSVKDHIFITTKSPRLRVYYGDQIEKDNKPKKTND